MSGRYDRVFERTVGMFVNTIVLRVDGRGHPTTTELVRRYKTFGEAAYTHQDVPFDLVVEAVRPVRSASHSPLFQVLFSYDYGFGGGLTMPGVEVRALDDPGSTSKFDLSATVGGDDHDFDHLTVEYLVARRSLGGGVRLPAHGRRPRTPGGRRAVPPSGRCAPPATGWPPTRSPAPPR